MDVFIANVEQTIINSRSFLNCIYLFAFLMFMSGVRIVGPDRIRHLAAFVCALVGLVYLVRLCIIGYVLLAAPDASSPWDEAALGRIVFVILVATGMPLVFDYWLARVRRRQTPA